MILFRVIFLSIVLVSPLLCMGNTNMNNVEITTFRDTTYSSELPPIEFRTGTYHNFDSVTTVGYKLILRGEDLYINGALLYKEAPEANINNPLRLSAPFHIHVGDKLDKHRIGHVYITNTFPFSEYFSFDDSLVILTNKGNFTLYLIEDKRITVRLKSVTENLSATQHELESTRLKIYIIISISVLICLILGLIFFMRYRRIKRIKTEHINMLLATLSEDEMNNRNLKSQIADLIRSRFDTINQLCYEYFEKADTNFLKKSIYIKVEDEINRLKSPEQLSKYEKLLNEFCDGIILRIKAQIPQLSDAETTLLIYLYSGLSARTICVLMDIQLKTFYMRRLRLKNKIEASDAPDKEWFISNM